MNNSPTTDQDPLSIKQAKMLAKRLRTQLERDEKPVSIAKSLELLAAQHGYRDWNTMVANINKTTLLEKKPVHIGQRVSGWYLGHAFIARVLGVQVQNGGNRFRVTIDLDEAVDVVSFDSFSSFRKRITSVINQDGITTEMNSNGVPILKLDI